MDATIKALIAKSWKDEEANLDSGRHYFEEEFVARVSGTVEKQDDEFVAPTVSIPLIPVLALFWKKCGIAQDEAMALLREALTEAMKAGVTEDGHIKRRIHDVNAAIKAVRKDLINRLPKMHRSGKTITKDLDITVMPLSMIEKYEIAAA